MARPTINLSGVITSPKGDVPVRITYGSRFSFFVDFPQGRGRSPDEVFPGLAVGVAGEEYQFGACRFFPESNIYGYSGRLIFTDEVYDFKSLIYERKIVTLETAFQNLQLILSQREKIHPRFKEFTANLTYDFEVYRHFFDDLDSKYMDEPQHVGEVVQKTIIDRQGGEFMQFFDTKLEELMDVIRGFTRDEHVNHGFYFRKQVWGFILCSEILTRTNLKPRGYAGDSQMLNMVYENGYRGSSTFSKLLHKHTMGTRASQAVRNRRQMLAGAICAETLPAEGPLRIMSVACGSAVELVDVFQSASDLDKYHFTLFDQDIQALSEAAKNVTAVEDKFERKVQVDYVNASVRTMLRPHQSSSDLGRFDVVYSMGLFDYLTPPVAKAVAEKLYGMLNPGGVLIVGNYHADNPDRYYMEYWMDWVLYYRTEEEFLAVASGLNDAEKRIDFEATGCQMFLQIRKPSGRGL